MSYPEADGNIYFCSHKSILRKGDSGDGEVGPAYECYNVASGEISAPVVYNYLNAEGVLPEDAKMIGYTAPPPSSCEITKHRMRVLARYLVVILIVTALLFLLYFAYRKVSKTHGYSSSPSSRPSLAGRVF